MNRSEFVSPLFPLDGDGFRDHLHPCGRHQRFADSTTCSVGENSDKVAQLLAKDELYQCQSGARPQRPAFAGPDGLLNTPTYSLRRQGRHGRRQLLRARARSSFAGGDIMLGGGGNDRLQGGGGDDIIDGDAFLHVDLLRMPMASSSPAARSFAKSVTPTRRSRRQCGRHRASTTASAANYTLTVQVSNGIGGFGPTDHPCARCGRPSPVQIDRRQHPPRTDAQGFATIVAFPTAQRCSRPLPHHWSTKAPICCATSSGWSSPTSASISPARPLNHLRTGGT